MNDVSHCSSGHTEGVGYLHHRYSPTVHLSDRSHLPLCQFCTWLIFSTQKRGQTVPSSESASRHLVLCVLLMSSLVYVVLMHAQRVVACVKRAETGGDLPPQLLRENQPVPTPLTPTLSYTRIAVGPHCSSPDDTLCHFRLFTIFAVLATVAPSVSRGTACPDSICSFTRAVSVFQGTPISRVGGFVLPNRESRISFSSSRASLISPRRNLHDTVTAMMSP